MVYGQIYIGECDKVQIIKDYVATHDITKIYIIGQPLELGLVVDTECIKLSDTIMYKYYYRLLQEVKMSSLIILNECLTKTNRYDLTYNCIRKYMLQTHNRLIFNYYPLIKQGEDFMTLYDMITPNPFLKEPYKYMTHFEGVHLYPTRLDIEKDEIKLTEEQKTEYEEEKERIIGEVKKDPDIIPRRLLKWTEKQKPKGYDRLDKIKPHMKVCVSDAKVDAYYYQQILNFKEELTNVRENLQH